jgi:hypothetical protein
VGIWLHESVSNGTVVSPPKRKQWAAALEGSRPIGRGKQLTVFLRCLYAAAQRPELAIVLTGLAVLDLRRIDRAASRTIAAVYKRDHARGNTITHERAILFADQSRSEILLHRRSGLSGVEKVLMAL